MLIFGGKKMHRHSQMPLVRSPVTLVPLFPSLARLQYPQAAGASLAWSGRVTRDLSFPAIPPSAWTEPHPRPDQNTPVLG